MTTLRPTTLETQTVPNLVQGISQQAKQVRRTTQCDSQFDCLNLPVEGCTPRPGLDYLALANTDDNTDAFFYHILRTSVERYTIVVRKDGTLKAYNFLTGVECTVEVIDAAATTYLAANHGGADLPWNTYAATSADDVTFIANTTVKPAMKSGSGISTVRPFECLFFVKGGAYENTYQIGINYLGTWYNWSYTTPDNSVPGNAADITPSAICFALYNAMVTDPTNPIVTHLGFSIQRDANLIRLWRTDSHDFDIKTDDGENNNFMLGLKDEITSFDMLPQSGYNGMVFKVDGDPSTDADDYYVKFNSKGLTSSSTTQGAWEETVAQGTPTELDGTTMPVSLVNDNVNHFTLGLGDWGNRLVGDGINSAKDPSFVGRYIADLFFDQRRLAVMHDAGSVWSRTNNPFVFFPDTIQADLATAPIDELVKASKGIAVLKHPLQVAKDTYIWAEGKQFYVGKVDNTVFSDQTIEIDPVTTYEWNEDVPPQVFGTSTIFATEVGKWTNFTDADFQQGTSTGATGITDHVPKLVPSGVRVIAGSDTVKKLVIYSEATPNLLYVYEYRLDGNGNRLQSAWNIWRLPDNSHVLYAFMDKDLLYLWVQRTEGMVLLRCSLQPSQEDAEGQYLTRLDMRLTEAQCVVNYSSDIERTTITLPFDISDAMAWMQATTDNPTLQVVVRQGDSAFLRGQIITANDPQISVVGGKTVLSVPGDFSAATFYAGLRIRSERTENTFYIHDANDAYVNADRLQVAKVAVQFNQSGYFRAEVSTKARTLVTAYEGRQYGDPLTIYDAVVLGDGNLDVPVAQLNTDVSITLVADTYLPCSWQGMVWTYNPTTRA